MMRYRKTAALLLILFFAVTLSACSFCRVLKYRDSEVYDYKIFASRPLLPSNSPAPLAVSKSKWHFPDKVEIKRGENVSLDEFAKRSQTLAILVLKDGELILERYYNGHSRQALSMSFSMAKTFLSILVGCALADGSIQSLDQPVTDYLPEMREKGFDKVTLKHLIQMTSGMNYKENDNPFGRHPRYYYTEHIEQMTLDLKVKKEPGTEFRYKSGENQMLGLALQRAIAPKTLTEYMQEKLWTPLGMEYGGLWSMDREGGVEKTFCCISARAVDFIKFGKLYLNHGRAQGRQIVPADYVAKSTCVDESKGSSWEYQYGWWIVDKTSGDYMASGHLGQYIYVSPKNNAVVLRVGEGRGKTTPEQWRKLMRRLCEATKS